MSFNTAGLTQAAFAEALAHHHAGRLNEAERLYQQILRSNPNHSDSLHLLGVIAHQIGRNDIAIELIGKAISVTGDSAAYYVNLGLSYKALGRCDDAVSALTEALRLDPSIAQAHAILGATLYDLKRYEDALAALKAALLLDPALVDAHLNVGNVLKHLGRLEEAGTAYHHSVRLGVTDADANMILGLCFLDLKRLDDAIAAMTSAIRLNPQSFDAHCNLGVILGNQGRTGDAIAAFTEALRINPVLAQAWSNLGVMFKAAGRLNDARLALQTALCIEPVYAEAYSNLGVVLFDLGRLRSSVSACNAALSLDPNYAEAYLNLGNALRESGCQDQAVDAFRAAVRLKPQFTDAHSNLLQSLHYQPGNSEAAIFKAAQDFAAIFKSLSPRLHVPNRADAERRLKIGYVSGDFRRHPVGFFLVPVFAHRDRAEAEIFCYSNSPHADDLTAQLRASADHWRDLTAMPDQVAADLIAADGIDVLVDLSGHTGLNRLPLFARKPAPVQVTWAGYVGTTGLSAMDYIIADRFVAPDSSAPYFTENIWRLSRSYISMSAPDMDCPVLAPPSARDAPLTFGSFNNNSKTSSLTIDLWSRVLKAVPDSRLLLKTRALDDRETCARLRGQFADHGIDDQRLLFEGPSPRDQLLSAYNRLDIALDPTPYGGGVTTAEALWMGVPVVSLRGDTWVGRAPESILSTVGLPDLVAASADEFVDIALNLANDAKRLESLRAGLRAQVEQSFFDGARFTRELETAYREMWRIWCHSRSI